MAAGQPLHRSGPSTGQLPEPFLFRLALGSASELEYHLLLARDLALLPEPEYAHLAGLASEVKRMLSSLATTLSADVKLKADG